MNVSKYVKDNKSDIAFGLGLTLSVASTVFAAIHSHKIKARIEEAKANLPEGEKLRIRDYIKACWKDILPSALTTAGSVACLCISKKEDHKTIAATLGAYLMESEFRKTFEEKVREQLGDEKTEELQKKVLSEKNVELESAEDPFYRYQLKPGECRFKDQFLNKSFISTMNDLKEALNIFNDRLNNDESACLNDFYSVIWEKNPIPLNRKLLCDLGEFIGFHRAKGLLDLDFIPDKDTLDDGSIVPVFTIQFLSKSTGRDRMPQMFYEVGE